MQSYIWLWSLLGLGLLSIFSSLVLQSRPVWVNKLSILIVSALFFISLALHWLVPEDYHTAISIASFSNITLTIELLFDQLAWVMLCLISFISLLIYSYSTRYLFSDNSQARFISQLSGLTTAVMFFVMSGNLFTAFVAWQLVGLCLYLLLNHYHYDVKANKAAKKKFVINRIGDICFMLAVIITYLHYGTTSFLVLFSKHIGLVGSSLFISQTTILLLLFAAVMTKSAQFPFHIWLPDTMETPTPVSALMHAGVINAGGFLLARLSPWFVQQPMLMACIYVVGLLTTLMGGFFMLTQTDVKKQLAYSTIGQMGYMVMQCGLGCFAAAVFHLIAHGFFKGSLFLHAGNALNEASNKKAKAFHGNWSYSLLITTVLTIVLVMLGFSLLEWVGEPKALNQVLWLFLVITLAQFIWGMVSKMRSIQQIIVPYLGLGVIFLGYIAIVTQFNHMLEGIALENAISVSPWEWGLVLFCLLGVMGAVLYFSLQTTYTRSYKVLYAISLTKAGLEKAYRYYFIKPLRQSGEWCYLALKKNTASQKNLWLLLSLILSFLFGCTIMGLFIWYEGLEIYSTVLLWVHLILFIISLLIANRTRTLREQWVFVFISGLTLTNLALFAREEAAVIIGVFHFINMLVLFLALALLTIQQGKKALSRPIQANRLPWVNVYISIFLLLLVGTPGTAGFISEFYLIQNLLMYHAVLAVALAFSFVLLAIVVLHTLQVYIFNPGYFSRLDPKLSPMLHGLFWSAIVFNVFNGLYPQMMLHLLSRS